MAAAARSHTAAGPLIVDAHVHLHRAFDLDTFLSAAAENFARAALQHGAGDKSVGILLLAEGRHENAFARLRDTSGSRAGGWSIHPSSEPDSLLVRRGGRLAIVAIAGRQLVTSEGVEVLGLLGAGPFSDGATLMGTVAHVRRAGAMPVLPWGFGKWTLRRGALVQSLLRSSEGPIFLGDNGGRLSLARYPKLLEEGRSLSVPILPGSDPLPFRDQETRAGSFGFLADVAIDGETPAAGLRLWLQGLTTQPPTYGQLETLGSFCWNQVRMQWRKRVSPRE